MKSYLAGFFCSLTLLLFSSSVLAEIKTPQFSVDSSNGPLSLAQYKGEVVYLDFWASWCGPCKLSLPWMTEIQKKYAEKGLKVIAINVDSNREDALSLLKSLPGELAVGFDPDGKVPELFQVQGMPSSFLIDKKGNIRSRHSGFRDSDKSGIEAELEKLLEESA